MKKIVSLLLTLGLTAGLLTGCGGGEGGGTDANNGAASGNESQGAENTGTEDGSANAAADGDTYHMVVEIVNYGFDDPDLGMIQDAVNEITVPEIGVEVEFMTVPIAEMATKLGLLVSGNQQIDLVCTGLLTTPSNLVADGLIQPITEYVQGSEALMKLAGNDIEACTINGEIYAYPGATANGQQSGYFYDKDLAEQYQIEVPEKLETASDWEKLFEQIRASGMSQYGISLGDGQCAEDLWATFDSLGERSYLSYGVVMDMTNGTTVENYYATEKYKEKCKMRREWYEKGYSVPDSISNGYSTMDSMSQGMIFGCVASCGTGMSTAYWSKTTGKNLGYIPISEVTINSASVINFSWGVSTSCERPEKAVEFLELLYTNTELANIMNYGIEDVHYVTTEGSKIIRYPEGLDGSNCPYGSFVGTYGDTMAIYQREPLTDEDVENFKNFQAPQATPSKFMGYSFDPSEVQTAITAVTAVINQYAPALECGTVDPEVMIPEFLEALDAAGMQTIIDANQEQLDAWLEQQ